MLTLPKKQKKKMLTVQIELELLKEVKRRTKAKGLTIRQAVEYGMAAFLKASE